MSNRLAMLLIASLYPQRANPWADDCKVPSSSAYLLQKKHLTLQDEVVNIPKSILRRFSQLIKMCWNEDPLQRPHFTELRSMSDFMQNDSITNMKAAVDQSTGTRDQIHYNDKSNEHDSVDTKKCTKDRIWKPSDILLSFEEAGSLIPKDLHANIST